MLKRLVKNIVRAVFVLLAFPLAALCGFGRWVYPYVIGAHLVALGPGILGDYLRSGYYCLTLRSCPFHCRISFGAIFSHPDAMVSESVYIGPYSVMGRVRIGQGTQIATHVQILSGANQHKRDAEGRIQGSEEGEFKPVTIGRHSWIGAGAIVMASVGDKTIIGAGAVVTKEIPEGVVAVGNPARILDRGGESTRS